MARIIQSFKAMIKAWIGRIQSAFTMNEHAATARANHHHAQEKAQLLRELQLAKQQWHEARIKLDFMLDEDAIDQAIFAFEAAERRYNLLIKRAKLLKLDAFDTNKEEE